MNFGGSVLGNEFKKSANSSYRLKNNKINQLNVNRFFEQLFHLTICKNNLFFLFLEFFVFQNTTLASRCDNSFRAKHRDLNLADTAVIGRIVYEGDHSYIEVFESWKGNVKKIELTRGKYKYGVISDRFSCSKFSALPPEGSVVHFMKIATPEGELPKINPNFHSILAASFIYPGVDNVFMKNLYSEFGLPKFYPNGNNYKIPERQSILSNINFNENEFKKIEADRTFFTKWELERAQVLSLGTVKKRGEDIYIEVSESWSSIDPEIFVSHGKFDKTKDIPMAQSNPFIDLRYNIGEKIFILSFLSPDKVNSPLKRKLTPLDSFPKYNFAALDGLNTSISKFVPENYDKIKKAMGEPKFKIDRAINPK